MIEIRTNLKVTPEASAKTVVMEMDVDAAMALATLLLNHEYSDLVVSAAWDEALRKTAQHLIDAGNRCR